MQAASEVWRDAVGYEGLYEVSSLGKIRSQRRVVGAAHKSIAVRRGRVLSQATKNNGYKQVTMVDDHGKHKSMLVHRVTLLAFHGEPSDGQIGRHLDGNKANNVATNLRWGTYSQNNGEDKRAQGTMPLGEAHHNAKLTPDDVRDMRALRANGLTGAEIAERYPQIRRDSVYAILRYKTWTHI